MIDITSGTSTQMQYIGQDLRVWIQTRWFVGEGSSLSFDIVLYSIPVSIKEIDWTVLENICYLSKLPPRYTLFQSDVFSDNIVIDNRTSAPAV